MKTAYPTIKQSIGIVGILFCCMIVASPALFAENLIGKEASFLLYYVISTGIALAAALALRKNKTHEQPFRFEIEDPSIIPFIIVATMALLFGVTMPLMSLIPISDFFKKVFIEFGSQTGFFSFLSIVIAAPILEELIFRGVILDGFLKRYSPTKAILFSSFLFGFIHLNPWQFVGAGIIGIFMGWVYYRTRSVSLTIIIHLSNNLAAFAMGQMSELTMENIDDSMVEYYGGMIPFFLVTSASLLILLGCIHYLNQKMYPRPEELYAEPLETAVAGPVNDSHDGIHNVDIDGSGRAGNNLM
jgi:uncharacterized protein